MFIINIKNMCSNVDLDVTFGRPGGFGYDWIIFLDVIFFYVR